MILTDTGSIVYQRTYARTKPDGSKETWPETVERVVDGNLGLVDPSRHIRGERQRLIEMMTGFKIIPAGRHLWASGVPGRQYLYNCFVSGWGKDPWEHFEFTFLRLMEGGGVGANYSNQHLAGYGPVQQVLDVEIVCDPSHPDYQALYDAGLLSEVYGSDWTGSFEVEDSREGWAAALVDLIRDYYRTDTKHPHRVFDVSRVRPAGARLKQFGGTASGPVPLARMLREVGDVLDRSCLLQLDGISAMAIDHAIAKCVVSGGVRRSARMAIMHWDDPQIEKFLTCKSGDGLNHWTTNISVEVDHAFWDAVDNHDLTALWVLRMIAEGMLANGEPGIWNSSYSNIGEPNVVHATNPCLTGDTVIATVDGPRTFADLAEAGEDVEVYSWHPKTKKPVIRWMRQPRLTRENAEILKVTFDSGLVVRCTPDHSFFGFRGGKVKARDLRVGQAVRAFSASRDNSGHERVHGWDSKENKAIHQWTHRMRWENENGPIPDGMVVAHLDHDATNNELSNLAVMTPYDHASYDYPLRKAAGFDGKCRNHKVVSVEPGGHADVYNGTVDDSHTYIVLDPEPVAGHMSGIVSANCGEIALEAWEPCNLGHINLAAFVGPGGRVNYAELREAHILMTRFLIRATYGDVNDPKQAEVLARNRRIGVGHLGVASFLAMTGNKLSDIKNSHWFHKRLDEWAELVDFAAVDYSHQLRIPVPVKKRTVAPTGTISKLCGVSEGIHPVFARYFIRRIRFSILDPAQGQQLEDYVDQGYHVEQDLYAANTWVVEIPTKDILVEAVEDIHGAGMGDVLVEAAGDLTLRQLLDIQVVYQSHWADNAVSFTANVKPDEYTLEDMMDVINDYGEQVKGFTIFPEKGFAQAPYEQITKEEYDEAIAKQTGDGVDEECAGGGCPIK